MKHDGQFYRRAPWLATRATYLRHHPFCEAPGCGERATHVDHRVSRANGGADYDPANLKAMCHSCHSRKTASADGGFGNARRRIGEQQPRGCDVDGNPISTAHHWRR